MEYKRNIYPLFLFNGLGLAISLLILFGNQSGPSSEPNRRIGVDRAELREMLIACSVEELSAMRAAGEEVATWYQRLSQTDSTILTEVLKGSRTFSKQKHYPEPAIWDSQTHSQYYYHAHRSNEHGHFHLFLGREGIPEEMNARFLSDEEKLEGYVHLLAISMDERGYPIGLFTVNQWLTGGDWYSATDIAKLVKRFCIEHTQPSWVVNRWLDAMLTLFYPQIVALLQERDCTLHSWSKEKGGWKSLTDEKLGVISTLPISIDMQRDVIEELLRLELVEKD